MLQPGSPKSPPKVRHFVENFQRAMLFLLRINNEEVQSAKSSVRSVRKVEGLHSNARQKHRKPVKVSDKHIGVTTPHFFFGYFMYQTAPFFTTTDTKW